MDYEYPFEVDWEMEEIITVISFYNCIEKAYEEGIESEELMASYREFKTIVDSKSLEKQIDKQFEESSSYSIFKTMKKAKTTAFVRMP